MGLVRLTAAGVAVIAIFPAALQAALPAAETVAPGAGTLLQDLRLPAPQAPSSAAPDLTLEPEVARNSTSSPPFTVKTIRILGNTVIATSTLHALVAEAEGKELTLSELDARVARIGRFYHDHGYPLARALIPAQTIQDGIVEVRVIEARYGKIRLVNDGAVGNALLEATLEPLKSGQLIEQSTLEHTLLLLADIPGISQSAILQRGEAAGSSDLLVQAQRGAPVTSTVSLDNDGNRYTGRVRASSELSLYDPLHHGDLLDAGVLTSGKGLEYGRLSYDALLDGAGTHAGAAYSALHYVLGQPLSALEGHGTAQVLSASMRRPLVRSVAFNLYGLVQFDRKVLRDALDASAIHTDRHLDAGTVGLSADLRDGLLAGGLNSWMLQWVQGNVGFDDPAARRIDATTARTAGRFSQWNASFTRQQRLGPEDGIILTVSSQSANANLDPAQKMVAGGRYTVRAYDMSALSADTGQQASIEIRHRLQKQWHGQWQATTFFDFAHVAINKNAWTSEKNDATLRGTGIGCAWTGGARWNAGAFVAARLGASPVLVADSSLIRAWFEISKGF
jgi:hemolysin activation/secretion protein